jgi:hypothetical protein
MEPGGKTLVFHMANGCHARGCARARGDGQLAVGVSAPKAESQILAVPTDIPAFVKSVGRSPIGNHWTGFSDFVLF